MQQKPNKERILSEALTLFSTRGYNAVSMNDIATAVGIKAPSLYNHYKGKKDIYNAIIDEMKIRYDKAASVMAIDGNDAKKDGQAFLEMDETQLLALGKNLFLFFLHDEFTCKFRKLLNMEQYHDQNTAALFVKQYVDEPLFYQEMLFLGLTKAGLMINENPKIMALHFFSPIYFLLTLCDAQPQREKEALEKLTEHIKQFNRLYKTSGGK